MKQWINLHQHTDESNISGYFEVVTKYSDYIDYAKKNDLNAVCITNHGNVFRWIKHKLAINKAGMKYIHGIEAYVTMDLKDNNRGFHTILIAKNYDGVKEINKLSSVSNNKKDGHFYYRPRISFEELTKTSNNIIITTACLGGALWQLGNVNGKNYNIPHFNAWIDFLIANKTRCFLEIQPHNDDDQKTYNQMLVGLSNKFNIPLIASNDVHALNQRHNELRLIVKKGKSKNKKSAYENDDKYELWCKSYDEMVKSFKKQGVVSQALVEDALDNTLKIVESIEDFELDTTHKYPKLYSDEEGEFKRIINQGFKDRGIIYKSKEEQKKYKERVLYEYDTYAKNGAISYMLADNWIVQTAKKNNIKFGYGRGSVSGSLIAFLTGETDVDPIQHNLSFERFMNPERVSLADIDRDYFGDDKLWMQQWLLTNDKIHAASIATANTYGLKDSIKAIARGHELYQDLKPYEVQQICNQIDSDDQYPQSLYQQYKILFDDAKEISGVIDSCGRHAAGILVSTETIDDSLGTQHISGWDYPVTQVDMKEIDYCNFVKFDILGVNNIGLISKTCELAKLPYLTPTHTDIINFQDENVWKSMCESNIGIFQFEGDRAFTILQKMFSEQTLAKIKQRIPNLNYMDLLSLANAAQRPSGASYIEAVTNGVFKDNGHVALNKFLEPTLGYLVYQEQMIDFLVEFCGYTPGHADIVRRGIAKKMPQILDEELPNIKKRFIQTMVTKHGDTQAHAKSIADDFIQVFVDAANYGFSINHSIAYSYIGYIITWLRYYYPLEFCTAAMMVWNDKQEKLNKVVDYAKNKGIQVKPLKFRKSKGNYYMDKKDNAIYEGTSIIKGNNAEVGDYLYSLRHLKFSCFTDLLVYLYDQNEYLIHQSRTNVLGIFLTNNIDSIKIADRLIKTGDREKVCSNNGTSCINSSKMLSLIQLGFFSEFGSINHNLMVFNKFKDVYKPKAKVLGNKFKKYLQIKDYEQQLNAPKDDIITLLSNELKYLGKCRTQLKKVGKNIHFVMDATSQRTTTSLSLYQIKTGKSIRCGVCDNTTAINPNTIIQVQEAVRVKNQYSHNNIIIKKFLTLKGYTSC